MSNFPVYTLESAAEGSRQALNGLARAFGFEPNIAGAIAGSPRLINGLIGLFQLVHGGSFTAAQIQTVLLTNALTSKAAWPVAFHSFLALKEGLGEADVKAIRDRNLPHGPSLPALSGIARTLIEKRGVISEADVDDFMAAGFEQALVLERI